MAQKKNEQKKPAGNSAGQKSKSSGAVKARSQSAARPAGVNAQGQKAGQSAGVSSQRQRRYRKTSGFAETKDFPHKKHPAKFKKKRGSDTVEYITFTHSEEVEIDNVVVLTKPLTSNINPKERGTLNDKGKPNISYAYPKVYVGKRSALGKGTNKYSLVEADKNIVDELFATLPREDVPKTSNSKKNDKK